MQTILSGTVFRPRGYDCFSNTNILPAPTHGISKIEDCADGCSLHPKCKAYVFYSNGDCYYKSTDEIPLVDATNSKSGSLTSCSHIKNAQAVLTINPLWPDCIIQGKNLAGQGKYKYDCYFN